MANYDFDVLIIGSGPGGYVAAVHAAQLGFKTACVEKMPTLGGTCLNVGCIPSKALLQSTEHYSWFKHSAQQHGIGATDLTLDFNAMMKRKEGVVKGLVDSVDGLFKRHHVESIQGEASFVDPHTIQINQGDRKVSAHHIIIATGSETIPLPFLKFDEKLIVTSTGALFAERIPKRLLVVGAGAIGVELASVFSRLGSEVKIIEMLPKITPAMDHAISNALAQLLKKQNIEFFLDAKVLSGKVEGEEVSLAGEQEKKSLSFTADMVLVAIGRRPYTKGLGLETIALPLDAKGLIPVDANFRTIHSHIYAIGDVITGPMLAHRASHEAIAAVETIAGRSASINYMAIPNVIYTNPEAAAVGLTEKEAQEAKLESVVGTSYFRGNARARCSGDSDGFVKVIGYHPSGRIIGMHILGPHASELIAEGVLAIEKKATLSEVANTCHAHPTLSEAVMDACQNALESAKSH